MDVKINVLQEAIMPREDLWTDENKKVVRDYWMQGYSALWIGTKLGKTRRSIMGLVWRMGLMRIERPSKPAPMTHGENKGTVGRKPIRAILGHKRSDGEPVSLKNVPMPEPSVAAKTSYRKDGKMTMEDLRHNSCRWPIGDPQLPGFGYCGAVTDGISPYCVIHKKVAFHNPRLTGRGFVLKTQAK